MRGEGSFIAQVEIDKGDLRYNVPVNTFFWMFGQIGLRGRGGGDVIGRSRF